MQFFNKTNENMKGNNTSPPLLTTFSHILLKTFTICPSFSCTFSKKQI